MIGHRIRSALPRLRAQAESTMTAVGVLEHPGAETLDPVTGWTSTAWVPYYSGPVGVLRSRGREQSGAELLAGQDLLEVSAVGRVPLSVAEVRPGDRLTVTSADDEELVGAPLFVVDVAVGTHMVQRRFTLSTTRGRHVSAGG